MRNALSRSLRQYYPDQVQGSVLSPARHPLDCLFFVIFIIPINVGMSTHTTIGKKSASLENLVGDLCWFQWSRLHQRARYNLLVALILGLGLYDTATYLNARILRLTSKSSMSD